MEEHLAVLLDFAKREADRQVAVEDVYVWWGKVRSANRQTPQAHKDEIRLVGRTLDADDPPETHLYLTDYRSLFVGELGAVRERELPESEWAHVPSYYREERLSCDFWFQLHDIRRLVHDDLPSVIESLKALRNTHYGDRPVSLYGGMVDLPLVVYRSDGARFFDPDERGELTGDRLWAEFDAETGTGIAAIERSLREDLLGDTAWSGLEVTTRTFIATGEKLFREHRGDLAFDFAPVIGSFAKALEVQVNATLRSVLPKLKPITRQANIGGRTVDLAAFRALTLGELAHAIGGERALSEGLTSVLANGVWFTGQLPVILDGFAAVRNPGTHVDRVDRQTALHWRNRLLGVGSVGDFVELARVKPKA